MWHTSEELLVAAPADRVWQVVADIEGHARLAGSGEVRAIRVTAPVAPGMVFEGDIAVGEVGSFVSRNVIESCEPPVLLAWVSYPPLDDGETEDHQIEVHWSFVLSPQGNDTLVEHTFRVPRPTLGTDELEQFLERTDRIATVRDGMRRTLANVKAEAESG